MYPKGIVKGPLSWGVPMLNGIAPLNNDIHDQNYY